jgi:UPF0716 protein FxsA
VETSILPSIAVLSSQSLELVHVSRPASDHQAPPTVPVKGTSQLAAAAAQILRHRKAQANRHGFVYSAPNARGTAMLRFTLGLILIALPMVELALLIKTGQAIGVWATLGLVVGAGFLGAMILAHQGVNVVRRTQQALAQGRPPVAPVLDGVFLVMAGALLITPGFLSDALALLLLIPPVRRGVARWGVKELVKRAQVQLKATGGRIEGAPGDPPGRGGPAKGPIIEGEFERLGEKATGPHRGKDRDRL